MDSVIDALSILIVPIIMIIAIVNSSKKINSSSNGQEPSTPNVMNRSQNIDSMNKQQPSHTNHNIPLPNKSYENTSAPKKASTQADLGIGKFKTKSANHDDMGSGVYFSERDTSSLIKTIIFTIILAVLVVMYFIV